MNDYLKAVIIGIVEGLTEFLPVSSTAHIRITQDLLGIPASDEYWKMFAIVIQLGAILSVVVYFWKRIVSFLGSFPNGAQGKNKWWNHPLSLVVIAFAVTAGPCYLIDDKIGENLESMHIIAWALIIGGVVMWVVDLIYADKGKTTDIAEMTFLQAMVIGAAQILAAAFPGTSRSMVTTAAGQMMGLTRSAALEFSFFLSIPVMMAATTLKLGKFVLKSEVDVTGHQWGVLAVGFIVSFIVALVVIHWFIGWVKKRGFTPFAVYRVLAGATILWAVYQGWIGQVITATP
jgi:undecaprenyl-diphosphatase